MRTTGDKAPSPTEAILMCAENARAYALVAMRHAGQAGDQVGEEHSRSLHGELVAIANGLAEVIVEARKLR